MQEKNIKFVMRVKQSESRAVKQFMQSPHRDVTTQWYPGHRSGKKLVEMNRVISRTAGLSVRMVKVMLNTGETEVPVTNLYDARVYDLQAIKEGYGLRLGIEIGYGQRKQQYRVNKNVSAGVLTHRAVRLFLEKQPLDILMELENLFDKPL
jgi:hypothetical protein